MWKRLGAAKTTNYDLMSKAELALYKRQILKDMHEYLDAENPD